MIEMLGENGYRGLQKKQKRKETKFSRFNLMKKIKPVDKLSVASRLLETPAENLSDPDLKYLELLHLH